MTQQTNVHDYNKRIVESHLNFRASVQTFQVQGNSQRWMLCQIWLDWKKQALTAKILREAKMSKTKSKRYKSKSLHGKTKML